MSELIRALQLARNVLWEVLVMHGKGQVVLPEELRKQVDSAERICGDVLEAREKKDE